MRNRITRTIGCLTLAGALLLGIGTATATAETTVYGPCLLDDPVVAMKCAHYKLQEARRLSERAGVACSQPALTIRDGVYLDWTCR